MAEYSSITPAPFKLGHHPRRADHYALLTADGALQGTFPAAATRAEIIDTLALTGLVLHDDDTVTRAADVAPTRRGLLSGMAGAAVAGTALVMTAPIAAAAESPDAELLAAIAQFDALERRIWPPEGRNCETFEEEHAADALAEPLKVEQRALLSRICTTPARTIDGLRARARSLVLWAPDIGVEIAESDRGRFGWDDWMVSALIRDLTGGHAA
jgi:hypothetical protein